MIDYIRRLTTEPPRSSRMKQFLKINHTIKKFTPVRLSDREIKKIYTQLCVNSPTFSLYEEISVFIVFTYEKVKLVILLCTWSFQVLQNWTDFVAPNSWKGTWESSANLCSICKKLILRYLGRWWQSQPIVFWLFMIALGNHTTVLVFLLITKYIFSKWFL